MPVIAFILLCKPPRAPRIAVLQPCLNMECDDHAASGANRTVGYPAAGRAVDCLAVGAHADGPDRHPDDGAPEPRSIGRRRAWGSDLFVRLDFLHWCDRRGDRKSTRLNSSH